MFARASIPWLLMHELKLLWRSLGQRKGATPAKRRPFRVPPWLVAVIVIGLVSAVFIPAALSLRDTEIVDQKQRQCDLLRLVDHNGNHVELSIAESVVGANLVRPGNGIHEICGSTYNRLSVSGRSGSHYQEAEYRIDDGLPR